jgi:hypothetical protein
MPLWNPVAKVFIEGVEYTSDALANVSINYGKKDISENFRASNATVSMISTGAGISVDLNDRVVVTFQDSANSDVTIFTGRVMDISVEMLAANWVQTNLNLLSPIARLGRKLINHSFSHEFDGDRVKAILDEAGQLSWLDATGTWAAQTTTWIQFESLYNNIDTPGFYELHSDNTAGFTTDLLNKAELTGQGHLYESTDGLINYQDAGARAADATANGYEPISSDDVLLSGTVAEFSTAFTTNTVDVEIYNGAITSEEDINSVDLYGRFYEAFKTELRNNADADDWALDYLGHYAYPKPVLSSFTIPLSQVTTTLRDILINMRGGLPVSISGLPAALAPTPYEGFVEGWQWRIQTGEAFITLNVSDKAFSV